VEWQPVAALPLPIAEAALLAIDAEPLLIRDAASASDDSGHTGTTAHSMASLVKKVCVVFFFCRAALLAIKLSESPFTNDLRKFQEIAGSAPFAMVAVAIDYISPDLGSLCHY
jgi:hypothetical protein